VVGAQRELQRAFSRSSTLADGSEPLIAGIATRVAPWLRRHAARVPERRGTLAVATASIVLGVAGAAAAQETVGGQAVDAARFQPGACVAFRPTAAVRLHRTVFIDPGHGGPDPGGMGTTSNGTSVAEAGLNVRVALDALPLLRSAGFEVVLARTGPNAVARAVPGDFSGQLYTALGIHHDLVARNLCADLAGANVAIGMFFDASASTLARGSLSLYDAARPFWRDSLRLADLMQHDVLAALDAHGAGVPDDGVHTDVGYGSKVSSADRAYDHLVLLGPPKRGYLANPTEMPAAVIEPLFLSNPAEAWLAASDRGQRAIANGLASAIEQYFGGASG
jgi:N-acetylmuramoyl-L-alanine amidase